MKFINSPVDSFEYLGKTFFVKRDDLLSREFSGNKARKLAYFIEQENFCIDTLISYGGSQSNLMYSLSVLAKLKHWKFIYYIRALASEAKRSIRSNLIQSLANGMELVEIKHNFKEFCQNLSLTTTNNQLLIHQGGAQIEAKFGLNQLACEILTWAKQKQFKELSIFTASGTGTTAWFLQQSLPQFKVYTTNCVGSSAYLLEQFSRLDNNTQGIYPVIFENKLFRFAVPDPCLYKIITEINKASQIEFDLVYDPVGWHILLENLAMLKQPILYLHCGGISGNSSMLARYHCHPKMPF